MVNSVGMYSVIYPGKLYNVADIVQTQALK